MSSLEQALVGAAGLVGSVDGIRAAASLMPDGYLAGTASVYPSRGVYQVAPNGMMRGLHEIKIIAAWGRADLGRTISRAMDFGEAIPNVLFGDRSLSGGAVTFEGLDYVFGELEWGGQQMVGWIWTLRKVKTLEAITMGNETAISGGLQEVVEGVQDLMGAISGVRAAPDVAPDKLGVFPFVVTYPRRGEWRGDAFEDLTARHELAVELHVGRADLFTGAEIALGIGDVMAKDLLRFPMLGGAASNVERLQYEFGGMEWNGVPTVGFRFTLDGLRMRGMVTRDEE